MLMYLLTYHYVISPKTSLVLSVTSFDSRGLAQNVVARRREAVAADAAVVGGLVLGLISIDIS